MSVQLAAALGVLSAAYEYLPAVQSHFSDGWVKWFALAIIGARLIQQQRVRGNDPADY